MVPLSSVPSLAPAVRNPSAPAPANNFDNGTFYFIASQLNGMVLDVQNANPLPGTQVFMYNRNGGTNQQWRIDSATGTIRSRLNGLCLDIEGGHLVLNHYQSGKENQQWERNGKLIANRIYKNMVLDIENQNKQQGAKVISFRVHNGPNQCWNFVLV